MLHPENALHAALMVCAFLDRKRCPARLLGGRRLGIVLSDHTDDDGATIFRHACRMGLEGIVSKRLTAPYRSGLRGMAQGEEP
jgi:ATP-dependent DNA ligase